MIFCQVVVTVKSQKLAKHEYIQKHLHVYVNLRGLSARQNFLGIIICVSRSEIIYTFA